MLNLLRRSKNKRAAHRQDNEEEYSTTTTKRTNYPANEPSNNSSATIIGQKPLPPQRRIHGKFTTAIDALEDFNDLEDTATTKKTLQEKQTSNEEREACFAKIYFEDTDPIRNINLATTQTTAPTTLTAGKKPVSFVGGGSIVGSTTINDNSNSNDDDDGSSSSGGAHQDFLNFARKQANSAIKKTAKTTRKSLGFRKVDLDGVNSVIEAILPNDAGEYSNDQQQQQLPQPNSIRADSERLNVNRRSLSQNERAELSGHVSSQPWSSTPDHQVVCDIDQAESNVSKNSKAFNNCESLATTNQSNSTGYVRCDDQTIDQNESVTTIKGFDNTATAAVADKGIKQLASSELPQSNSKQIKAIRRRSYFQRKHNNESSPNETSATSSTAIEHDSEVAQKVEEKKSQGPLQKGKKLLTDIFMARGRHQSHQRNRNQSQSAAKQQPQQEPCNNTQQQQQCNAPVSANHNDCQNAIISNKDNTTISDIRNNFTADNQNQNRNIDRATEPTTTMLRRHLETSNNANRYRNPNVSHPPSSETTLSNNSGKNASRRDVYDDAGGNYQQTRSNVRGNGLQHQRSNSAEHHRERRESHNNAADNSCKHERAFSEEPSRPERRRWSGALRDFVRVPLGTEQTSSDEAKPTQSFVIRAGITEHNGTQADAIVSGKPFIENNKTPNDQLHILNNFSEDGREKSERDRLKLSQKFHQQQTTETRKFNTNANSMGQSYGKNETGVEESRASTPREFRESKIPETDILSFNDNGPKVPLPKITVSDCSASGSSSNSGGGYCRGNSIPVEHEIFYEFESESPKSNSAIGSNLKNIRETPSVQIEDINEGSDTDDEVFHEQVSNSQPTQYTTYRHHSPLRHSPMTFLEDVPEQEEDETAAEDAKKDTKTNVNDIGNELLRRSRSRHANSASITPERGQLKSCDSNLSNSYPDSGISGCSESLFGSPESNAVNATTATNNTKTSPRSSLPPQCRRQRSPFVRDSTSTDCDDTLLQCDDLDCFASPTTSTTTVISGGGERLVCIESISLPDVVESTTSSPGIGNGQNNSASSIGVNSGGAGGGCEQIININGATGNSMGNVHFIPIHIEGGSSKTRESSPNHQQQSQKRRSIDDSVIGSGMKGSRLAHLNGNFDLSSKPTIEIVEEDDKSMGFNVNKSNDNEIKTEKLRLELQEQKSRFSAQLEDAHKNVQNLQTKINDMQTKIANLEQELSVKTWNVENLQSELNATQREDEFVRKKLRLLEEEKTSLRQKYHENEDEFRKKYEELENEYKELEEKYKNTQKLASDLQVQLARAQSEAERWRSDVDKIRTELEEQVRILQNAFENSEAERKICEDKWQKEFEMLRTQHMDREETLMTDCEWQLRQMQKQWKDKLDISEHARRDAIDTSELMGLELDARKQEIESLRHYESEVKSLRGVVSEQDNCIQTLMTQIESLKSELHTANEKLEDQIEAVKKIKYQCDNALCDKERQMIYRIDEVRNEAASFWENKLHTEMTRLTHELESVYIDERRNALDKLQAEHVEELRALTNRYTANEEELRTELHELQESYENKRQDFLELRQKSDNTLLQTRMHLDRADREYQKAMCREEERRELLEETLRKEFEMEKEEMEEKFRERLEQVKEELIKELQDSQQEMTMKHRKELEQQKEKLRAEKDEAMHDLAERHRKKLAAAEDQIKETELRHQRDLNELKATYDEDKAALDKRDLSNANEIEQLHRRCRCLTNLFEEMRMRYERRDPRPEDLREIDELRTRCDSQERDIFNLTTTLREMQMQMSNLQQNDKTNKKNGKTIQKPPPKTIPTSCDVIYEENEERDSPPPPPEALNKQNGIENESTDAEEEEDEDDEIDEDNVDTKNTNTFKGNKVVNGSISEVH